jgi:23S rRNA pseudouridine2605 synthase
MPRKSTKQRTTKKSAARTADQKQRLQRLLASAGFGSRRQCEELIEEGRVAVDGQIVTKLGTTADPEVNKVHVDGVLLKKRKSVYYAVNKPVGFVTTNRDPQGRNRVVDLVPPDERVFPVGRLDRNSEGLILLTNDGELAQRLTHPKFGVRKIYRVTVAGKVDGETMKQMRKGIYIAEGFVRVEGAKLIKSRGRSTEMEIVLREGKNREIRRILARLGHKVQHLRRIAIGPLRLGDIPPGAYRVVRHEEVKKLWTATEQAEQHGTSPSKKKRGLKKPKPGRQSKSTGRPSKKSKSKAAELDFGGSQRTGAVIGGDPSTGNKTAKASRKTKQRSTKKKTSKGKSSKKTTSRKLTSSKRAGKQTAKRSPGRKRKR